MELQINSNVQDASPKKIGKITVLITPPIDEDFWIFRVPLSDKQAIVGFPKFFTIGIGFQVEEDWNTNLPYTADAKKIFNHISHNKWDDSISDADCIAAIRIVQEAATKYQEIKTQKTAQ